MQTIDILNQQINDLRLYGLKESIQTRISQATKDDTDLVSFMSILLQDEIDYKKRARIQRLLKRASFKQKASLESFDYSGNRGVSKKNIGDFSTCQFIRDGINMIISGPTGVGKSFLSQAIGNNACRQGISVSFYRMNALMEQTALERAKSGYLNFLKRLTSVDLLVLDDFGIKPLMAEQFQDFYDIIDERGESRSLVITTQVPIENWNEIVTDPVICEAITDRIVAGSINLKMKGESYRAKSKKV